MTPDAVASYLKQHPEFFEHYADLLATIFTPHPHGGRAISISERQILTLREKNKQLEGKLRELIEIGEENDGIGEKLHRLTVALFDATDAAAAIHALYFNLREDFAVPHTVLRLWDDSAHSDLPEFKDASAETREFVDGLTGPYCSAQAMADTAAWFGDDAALLRSFAYVPLKGEHAGGLLALASEDAKRFYPEVGTLYLKRLGELTSAALTRALARTADETRPGEA